MQKLLETNLSNFQAMILFWLQIGVKNLAVDLDLSTLDVYEDCEITFEQVGFEMCEDESWSSYFRVSEFDGEDGEILVRGDDIVYGEHNSQRLVYRTLSALVMFNLDLAIDYENERLEDEADTYQSCEKSLRPFGCYCWRCRHARFGSKHIPGCVMCQSIGRTVEAAEKCEAIPF